MHFAAIIAHIIRIINEHHLAEIRKEIEIRMEVKPPFQALVLFTLKGGFRLNTMEEDEDREDHWEIIHIIRT